MTSGLFPASASLRNVAIGTLGAIVLMTANGPADAQACDFRWPQVQFARDDLQRAASDGDLATAQDLADRARREFDHLAGAARRCGCDLAAAKFEEAAAQVRHAQESESRKELRNVINPVKTQFEAALQQLENCRKR